MARVAATPATKKVAATPTKVAATPAKKVVANPVRTPATPAKKVAATPVAKKVAATPVSSAAPRVASTPAASASYSGPAVSSGGGGGVGGTGSIADFAAEVAPVQTALEIPDPLADATYQRQTAELVRAMADFNAQQELAKGQYNTQYNQGLRRLGWDQQAGNRSGFANGTIAQGGGWSRALPGAYGQAYDANENDFAGRGLYNSGLRVQAVSNLNDDFTDRKNTMDTARTDWTATQDLNRKNLESSQEATRQSAMSDAIARIAAQYGVNLSDVTPGRANQVMR